MYVVYINTKQAANIAERSRCFETKKAAEKWANWLISRPYASMVQVWQNDAALILERRA